MPPDPKNLRASLLLAIAILFVGLIFAGYMEFLADPVVDRAPRHASDGRGLSVEWITARSRVLNRPASRLVMIEGKGSSRIHNTWIWRHAPVEWVGSECVLLSDAEGIRSCSPAVFRELWKLKESAPDPFPVSLLRQICEETRDSDLRRFLARNAQ